MRVRTIGRLQRLDQKFVSAGFDARHFIFRALHAGGHQNRNELRSPIGFDQAAEIRTTHFRHHQVDHDQVDLFVLQNLYRNRRPFRFQNPIVARS